MWPILCFSLLVGLSLLAASNVQTAHAQTENPDRKIVYRVEPDYPPDLKRAGIGGYVRLEATITSSGAVEDTNVTGGNPILAEAAVRAIKKWKYEPTSSRTKAKLIFHFVP
jgi:TonB family protein